MARSPAIDNASQSSSSNISLQKGSYGRRRMTTSVKAGKQLKRINLTLADKLVILTWMTENPNSAQNEVIAHFKEQFPTLSQSTISRIWTGREKLLEDAKDPARLSFKRPRIVEHPDLELALRNWCFQMLGKGIKLSGELIRMKGTQLQELLNIPLEERLTFSDGWLDKFKQRLGLKEIKSHGEAGSVSESGVDAATKRLRELTDKWPLSRILNFDETGLFYRMPPDRGLAQIQTAGLKGNKTRLTFGLCASADGTLKLPPLIIGHFRKPRAFQGNEGKDMGFDYYWNKKAWMTGSIFQLFLENLNRKMAFCKEKVLLLVDNAPSHIVDQTKLDWVQVEFLEPNMTSHIQPCDAGIIRTFKAHYRRFYLRHVLENEKVEVENIWHVNQLDAMRMAEEAWNCVSISTIEHCWQHTGILTPRGPDGVTLTTDDAPGRVSVSPKSGPPSVGKSLELLQKVLDELAAKKLTGPRVMKASEMVDDEEERVTEKEWTDEELVEQARLELYPENDDSVGCDEEDEDSLAVLSTGKALHALKELERFGMQQAEEEWREAMRLWPKLICGLRKAHQDSHTQAEINGYFTKNV